MRSLLVSSTFLIHPLFILLLLWLFYAGQGGIRPLSQIPAKYAPFNNAHRVIRRQDQSSFVLLDPVEPDSKEYVRVPADMVASQSYLSYEVLIEEQIRLFIFHNLRMNDPNQDVTVHPLGYPEFAKVFNREFVQKPHELHAAFLHCAKPHDKPTVL
ncbi:hypothetical protein B0H14DRAFT_3486200 [Mycena olivaceomarginata]|nr:hypothetical protein B0H14DRAFT_3486200 [Mycena olivaceomarginata]